MIKKSLLTCLIILGAYNIVFLFFSFPELNHYNVWHRNISKAEELIYDTSPFPEIIISGSSMAANLSPKEISEHCYNLSMEGGSCISAIEIIKECRVKPKIILVEINTIDRKNDVNIAKNLFQPFMYNVRKYVPAFRDKNQPLLYIGHLYAMILDKIQYETTKIFPNSKSQPIAVNKINENLLLQMRLENLKRLNETVDSTNIMSKLKNLDSELNILKKMNIQIVFFEMPVGRIYNNSRKALMIREYSHKLARHNNYDWITINKEHDYTTIDDTHLDASSSILYSRYIKEQLLNILDKKKI